MMTTKKKKNYKLILGSSTNWRLSKVKIKNKKALAERV